MPPGSSVTTWLNITRRPSAWHHHQGFSWLLRHSIHVASILAHWSICYRSIIPSGSSVRFACWTTSAEADSKLELDVECRRLSWRTTVFRSWMHGKFLRKHLMWSQQDYATSAWLIEGSTIG